ncbi:carboxypeptidase regulatory-like domain-containing protein [Caldithrix abyssi]|nr:carboxypeptidase regulatory-like domain-containing protein [Caldithrix abyssi]
MIRVRFILFTALLVPVIFSQTTTKFTVSGVAIYKSGIVIEKAETILMDTTEKVIARTNTSKKFMKRYGGGKFSFNNVVPGKYKLRIITGEGIDINHRFELVDKAIDLGTLYPFKEFPAYTPLADYSDSTLVLLRRIPTTPVPEDSINIRHIIVDLDGNANTVIVDSIVQDSVYFTDFYDLTRGSVDLDKTYFIYNDYGYFIHQSRSMKDRMKELQRRDGYLIFQNGDTLHFDNIFFEPVLNNPKVSTFHNEDSTNHTVYHSLFDIYKIQTGPSYVENSVKKGFWTGIYTIGGLVGFQMISQKSFKPATDILPDMNPPVEGRYGTVITILPLFTLGRIGYDWYKDKRSNYFIPSNENDPFPRNMFVFSFSEWAWKKTQPVIKPIMNSKPVKWWKSRKLKKLKKQAAKRESASD